MVSALQQSTLDGYETLLPNQQHVNFQGLSGNDVHVFELYYDGAWHLNDLTQLAGAPPVAYPTMLNAYVTTFNNQQHINFDGIVGNELHVIELYYDGAWHWNDLTSLTGAPASSQLERGPHGYETSYNHQQHVNFISNDFHVHELYYDGAWHHNDLTQLTGAPPAGEIVNQEDESWGSGLTGYETLSPNQQHVNFIGNDLHVHELYYDGAWHHNDLTKFTGAPNADPHVAFALYSSLDSYATTYNRQQHVNFMANDAHVHELYYDGAWRHNDLTQLAGAPLIEGASPIDGYETLLPNQQHVNFLSLVGKDLHVCELYYDGAWHHNDLTQLTGAPPAQNLTGMDAYATSFNQQQHVNFVGTDLHVHELYYDGKWHYNDLTAIAK